MMHMGEYRVICAFNDVSDNSFLYSIGDVYPREGIHPTESRIQELMSSNNRQGKPLIERIADGTVEEKPLKKKRGKKNDND